MGADYVAAFDRIYPELAKKYEVPLYPFFLDGVVGHPDLQLGDGLASEREGNRYDRRSDRADAAEGIEGLMFVAVYWWKVHPGKEEQFRAAWRRGTELITANMAATDLGCIATRTAASSVWPNGRTRQPGAPRSTEDGL
jgi:hypothetical protein